MFSGIYDKRRFRIISILLAIVILVICCAILFDNCYDNTFAFTEDNLSSAGKDLGDILLDGYENRTDGKIFKDETMKALYKALTGNDKATFSDINKLTTLTAADIHTKNGNRDLVLTIDNKKWTVTHFTKDTDGNPIVTLWLASSAQTHLWNKYDSNNTSSDYPSCMYSSSYIRADALNSGGDGYVATEGTDTLTKVEQSANHLYSKFTMQGVKGSLTSYIVQPSKVAYQETENQTAGGSIGGKSVTLANEAYGTPDGNINWYTNMGENMAALPSKTGYSDWKDDYIWLPSLTEVGLNNTVTGIWGLSINQRSNSVNSWLRSGSYGVSAYKFAFAVESTGNSMDYNVLNPFAVRPAFHLNLAAADSNSVKSLSDPTDFSVTYDGNAKDISSASWYDKDIHGNSAKMSVTYSEASPKDVKDGGYEVTFTIVSNDLQWSNAQNFNDKTRKCKMTIEKAEPTVRPVIGAGPYYPGGNMPSISLSPGDTSGTIAWDDSKIVDGKTSYNWTFTSSDSNYKDTTGSSTLTLAGIEVNAIEASINLPQGTVIYTSTSRDSLKSYLTVTKKNNNGSSAGTALANEYKLSGALNKGTSTITVTLLKDGAETNITTTFDVTVEEVKLVSITASLNSDGSVYTTTPVDDIKSMLTVTGTNNDGSKLNITSDKYSISCTEADTGTLPAGSRTLTLTLDSDSSIKCEVTVQVSEPNVKSIKAEILADKLPAELYDNTVLNKLKEYIKVTATYDDADGTEKELAANEYVLTGKLVAGSTSYFTVTYGGKTTSVAFTNVVKFEVQSISAVSTQSGVIYSSASADDIKGSVMVTGVYNDNTDSVLTPDQFDIELPEGGLSSTNNTVTIKCGDKTTTVALTITDVASTGIEVEYTDSGDITIDSNPEDLLIGIKLTLKYNDGSSEVITATKDMLSGSMDSVGDKTITVTYTDPDNATITHTTTFTVNVGKGDYDMSGIKFEDKTVTFNGEPHSIEISGELPEGVTVSYEGNGQIAVNEEGYIVTAKFSHSNPNYNAIPDKTAKLIISDKPVYDMSGVTFEDKSDIVYDGNEYSIELGGELPDGVTYVYVYDGEESATPFTFTDAGSYEITIKFTGDEYHAPISDKRATLTISAADFDTSTLNFVGTEAAYDGEEHSISIDNLPEWLTVEYEGNGVSDMGKHSVTIKFTHSNSNYKPIPNMIVTLTIGKGKLAKPVYKGDIRYTGELIIPDVSDFEGYIEGVMEIVAEKAEFGLYVGKYTIVFAIIDTERYEWEDGDTQSEIRINRVSAKGNAILVLTDNITLASNETAVEWSIGKAKLTATKKDGALPIFSSTSYKGALDEVITYKYYTDKECTEEIAEEEIVSGQTYYVMASLEDSDNFELDTSAIRFVGTSFSYNAPMGELSTGEKIVQFLKKNWLWLVIALVALLILIIIIVLIARKKKDDNNGKGSNNNPPYPPYNGGQPPYPPYNGGQPPYPPYGQQPPYGGQPPYYDRMRAPIMPMAGMIQPQMQGSMQPTMNGAMQTGIGMQQQMPNAMQAQLQGSQMQAIQQPQQVQYVESATPALNAPNHTEHITSSGVGLLAEEIYKLRSDVEHIKSKSEEESIKLRSEVENARAMSAVESAKMQAMAEIERAKNEAKFAMKSGSINEAAATTVNSKAGAGDVLGDALMSAVAKMIVQGSMNGGNGTTTATLNQAQPIQNNANVVPQCPPGGRVTTTTMVDMSNNMENRGNIINPTNPPRSGGRNNSAVKSSGVNGNPFEVDGLYKKYYDEKGANESLLKPHEHGLYEKYYDDEN